MLTTAGINISDISPYVNMEYVVNCRLLSHYCFVEIRKISSRQKQGLQALFVNKERKRKEKKEDIDIK